MELYNILAFGGFVIILLCIMGMVLQSISDNATKFDKLFFIVFFISIFTISFTAMIMA